MIYKNIKEKPEDFIVEEVKNNKIFTVKYTLTQRIKDFLPKKEKKQLHATLVKTNWTTPRAIKAISRRLWISQKRIGYAGLKDKRAVTSQRISIFKIKIKDIKKIKIKDILLKEFEYSNERIRIGDLNGNKFTVVILGDSKKLKNKILSLKNKKLLNFFGAQRYSKNNKEIGKEMLKGNFKNAVEILFSPYNFKNLDWKEVLNGLPKRAGIERAVANHLIKYPNDYIGALRKIHKRLRKIFTHSYQSYLFDLYLKNSKGRINQEIPLVGYNTINLDEKYKKILKKEKMSVKKFRIKSMPEMSCSGSKRKTFFTAKNLKILNMRKNKIKISFTLKKGVYATTFLEVILNE